MPDARELDLALMMADLCGYTALTETHGALQASETVLRFDSLVKASLEPGVRIVDSIGDSVFCAGEDTRAIVRTALRLRDAAASEPGFPRISVGLHRGSVVERGARLFGAPINLAARLTAHAAGDQILCTEEVAQSIQPGDDMTFRPLGGHIFKNVVRPVTIYELARRRETAEIVFVDPVCRMQVSAAGSAGTSVFGGATYHFCSARCASLFSAAPVLYLTSMRGPAS